MIFQSLISVNLMFLVHIEMYLVEPDGDSQQKVHLNISKRSSDNNEPRDIIGKP